jgi:hypothetical protein
MEFSIELKNLTAAGKKHKKESVLLSWKYTLIMFTSDTDLSHEAQSLQNKQGEIS